MWDVEGLSSLWGRPWDCSLDEGVQSGDIRRLAEEEKHESLPKMFGHEARIHRLQLCREGFLGRGFAEQCAGCQAIFCAPRTLREE